MLALHYQTYYNYKFWSSVIYVIIYIIINNIYDIINNNIRILSVLVISAIKLKSSNGRWRGNRIFFLPFRILPIQK